jgi:hypothetical protein
VNRKLRKAIFDWLRLQNEGREHQAEEALQKAFSLMPIEAVPAGFSSRILAHLGIGAIPVSEPVWRPHWVLRSVLCSCLLLGAWFAWILPEMFPSILALVNPSKIAEVGVGTMVAAAQRFGEGLVVWRVLADISSSLTSALTSPQSLAMLAFGALLSILAFRTLHGLIDAERSSRYVGSV